LNEVNNSLDMNYGATLQKAYKGTPLLQALSHISGNTRIVITSCPLYNGTIAKHEGDHPTLTGHHSHLNKILFTATVGQMKERPDGRYPFLDVVATEYETQVTDTSNCDEQEAAHRAIPRPAIVDVRSMYEPEHREVDTAFTNFRGAIEGDDKTHGAIVPGFASVAMECLGATEVKEIEKILDAKWTRPIIFVQDAEQGVFLRTELKKSHACVQLLSPKSRCQMRNNFGALRNYFVNPHCILIVTMNSRYISAQEFNMSDLVIIGPGYSDDVRETCIARAVSCFVKEGLVCHGIG